MIPPAGYSQKDRRLASRMSASAALGAPRQPALGDKRHKERDLCVQRPLRYSERQLLMASVRREHETSCLGSPERYLGIRSLLRAIGYKC